MRALVVATCLLAACSGESAPDDSSGCGACKIPNLDGFCVPNLAGCDSNEGYRGYYGDDVGAFDPATASEGLYIDGGVFEVPAGEEMTRCTYVELDVPGDFILGRYEARMNPHSHHFNMLRYDPAAVREQGVPLGKPVECIAAGVPNYVAGSEWQYVDAPHPEGLGSRIPGGVVLELQTHYVNTTPEPIEGRVEVNLYQRRPEDVEHYVGLYFNVMTGFEVPPRSTARFRASCPAVEGVSVVLLTSHMHRFGKRFTVSLTENGATRELYESTRYDHPLIEDWGKAPLVLGATPSFEWSCEFENATEKIVREGEMGLTDEMCIMIAYYYDDPGGLPFCAQPGALVR